MKLKVLVVTALAVCCMTEVSADSIYHLYCPKCGRTWYSERWNGVCTSATCNGSPRKLDRKDVQSPSLPSGTGGGSSAYSSGESTSSIFWNGMREMQAAQRNRNRQFQQTMTDMFNQRATQQNQMLMRQLAAIEQTQGRAAAEAFARQKYAEHRQMMQANAPTWNAETYRLREGCKGRDFNRWFRSGSPEELQRLIAELSPPMGNYHAQWNPQKYQMMLQRYQELTGQQPNAQIPPQPQQTFQGSNQEFSFDPAQLEQLQQLFNAFMQQYSEMNDQAGMNGSVDSWDAQSPEATERYKASLRQLLARLGTSRCKDLWEDTDDLDRIFTKVFPMISDRENKTFEFMLFFHALGVAKMYRQQGLDPTNGIADTTDEDRDGIISEKEFIAICMAIDPSPRTTMDAKKEYLILTSLNKGPQKAITRQYFSEFARVFLTLLEGKEEPESQGGGVMTAGI